MGVVVVRVAVIVRVTVGGGRDHLAMLYYNITGVHRALRPPATRGGPNERRQTDVCRPFSSS